MSGILSNAAVKITVSTLVLTGQGSFRGFLLGTDGVNDPIITVYDGLDNTGVEIVPTCTYDASALGLNGVTGLNRYVETGIYIEITCAGSVELIPEYVAWGFARKLKYE